MQTAVTWTKPEPNLPSKDWWLAALQKNYNISMNRINKFHLPGKKHFQEKLPSFSDYIPITIYMYSLTRAWACYASGSCKKVSRQLVGSCNPRDPQLLFGHTCTAEVAVVPTSTRLRSEPPVSQATARHIQRAHPDTTHKYLNVTRWEGGSRKPSVFAGNVQDHEFFPLVVQGSPSHPSAGRIHGIMQLTALKASLSVLIKAII